MNYEKVVTFMQGILTQTVPHKFLTQMAPHILLKALLQVYTENTAQGGLLRDKYSTR